MKFRVFFLFAAAVLSFVAVSAVSADELDQVVTGRLASVNTSYNAKGDFRIESRRGPHVSDETIAMTASGLGAARDGSGAAPEYRAVLVDSVGAAADFGAVRLAKSGQASFRFDSRHGSFPNGTTTVTAFGGGTFELRRDGVAVLRGSIPNFLALGATGTRDSRTAFVGTSRLAATLNGGAGRGDVFAQAWSGPKKGGERVRINFRQLGTLGNPFAVVAIATGGAETSLGSITTRGASGTGSLVLDTVGGDSIPGGGIVGLSGETIEVRNSAGTPVLTGKFPSVP